MPNPSIPPQHFTPDPANGWSDRNGWLMRIPGDVIAAGSKGLPAASAAAASPREIEVDSPDLGRVRIRYEAKQFRHHRSSYWGWHAVWAERVA